MQRARHDSLSANDKLIPCTLYDLLIYQTIEYITQTQLENTSIHCY